MGMFLVCQGDWSSTSGIVPLSPSLVTFRSVIAADTQQRGHNVDNVRELTLGPLRRYTARRCEKCDWLLSECGELSETRMGPGRIVCLSSLYEVLLTVHMNMELSYATLGNHDGDQLSDWIFLGLPSSEATKVNGTIELSRCQTNLLAKLA